MSQRNACRRSAGDGPRCSLVPERARRLSWWRPVAFVARSALVFAVSIGMILLAPGGVGFVLAQSQPDPTELALERVEQFMENVQALRDLIDRTQFDVDALAFELAFEEPDAIVRWVRDHIAFEQYAGVLRGPQGTLTSRAGNAFDQAVLLAKLITDAGYDARVARGRLEPAAAEILIAAMVRPRTDAPAMGDMAEIEERLAEMARLVGIDDLEAFVRTDTESARPLRDAVALDVQLATESLLAALRDADVTMGSDRTLAALVEEAADYAWVEYRASPASSWLAVHPAVPAESEPLFEGLVADEVFEGTVPSDLLHRVRIQVFIERRLGDQLEVVAVTSPWERPAANLHGRSFTFTNVPDSFAADSVGAIPNVSDANVFVPSLAGEAFESFEVFDLRGAVIDPFAASDQAAGVVRNVGGAFGSAAGAVAGEERPEDFTALTRQWIEYTLIAPSGVESVHRRQVFDRIGAEARRTGEIRLDGDDVDVVRQNLTRQVTFMVNVGSFAPGMGLDEVLRTIQVNAPLVREMVRLKVDPGHVIRIDPADREDIAPYWAGHRDLYAAFDVGVPTGTLSYRPVPSLVVHEQDVPLEFMTSFRTGIDIVANERRSFDVGDGRLVPAPAANVAIGVWETYQEALALSSDLHEVAGAATALRAAQLDGVPFQVVAPDAREGLAALDLDASVDRYLARDLDAGYLVVVPVVVDAERGAVGWWRVDPNTGQTVGMASDGRGSASTERSLIETISMGIVMTLAAFSVWAVCTAIVQKHKPDKASTCVGLFFGVLSAPAGAVTSLVVAFLAAFVDLSL